MNYRLNPADRRHLPALAALERICFSPAWSVEMLADELYNPNASLIVAEGEDGKLLGYGLVRAVLDEGTLEKIAVAPAFRRQGVAQEILSAFLRFGAAHLAFLTLEVRAGNDAAIALYEKMGFQAVGRRKDYYTTPPEDAVLMTVTFQREGFA